MYTVSLYCKGSVVSLFNRKTDSFENERLERYSLSACQTNAIEAVLEEQANGRFGLHRGTSRGYFVVNYRRDDFNFRRHVEISSESPDNGAAFRIGSPATTSHYGPAESIPSRGNTPYYYYYYHRRLSRDVSLLRARIPSRTKRFETI